MRAQVRAQETILIMHCSFVSQTQYAVSFLLAFLLHFVAGKKLNQRLIVERVNNIGTTWKAEVNERFEGLSEESLNSQLGGLEEDSLDDYYLTVSIEYEDVGSLPDYFDAREMWPSCETTGEIRDQSSCGSCWAIAPVEAMSDRYCIHLNLNYHISTEDLLSCCSMCGKGCDGGHLRLAWAYWVRSGIVTGGGYNSSQGCKPYSLKECDHHVKGQYSSCTNMKYATPACYKSCQQHYGVEYARDKHFGKTFYSISGEGNMMNEIYNNGPLTVSFKVYEDFYTYKSGVYQHVTGTFKGNHAVKILGWGIESGTPFWLAANSWNTDWGEKGFFRIIRGYNALGLAYAGIPKY